MTSLLPNMLAQHVAGGVEKLGLSRDVQPLVWATGSVFEFQLLVAPRLIAIEK